MSIAIPGILVIATLLLAWVIISASVLDTGTTQAVSLSQTSGLRAERLGTLISITSANPVTTGGGTNVTVVVKNTGAVSVSKFPDMDVLVRYTLETGDLATKRLSYVTGTAGTDEWSLCSGGPMVCSISPDAFNPNIWDPDETATLSMRVVPEMKSGTSGTVVVVVPGGISDSTTF